MTDGIGGVHLWLAGAAATAAAAATSACLIVLLRPYLRRYAVARSTERSSHTVPTPQGGGIAVVVVTILTAIATAACVLVAPGTAAYFWTMLGAAVVLAVIGAVDDVRAAPVALRLTIQFVAVGAIVAAIPTDRNIIPFLPTWLDRAVLVICGVWFVNLVNFMDGIDWMTVAEVVPVSAALAAIGALGNFPFEFTIIALALLGGMIGFAPFNRPVATLFLGDVGSLPIGLMLGSLLLMLAVHGHFAAAILLPLYYLADATITLLRRLIEGEPVWQAHRTHFYQRAIDRGLAVQHVVGRVFAVNVLLAALAAITVIWRSSLVDAVAVALGTALVAWLLRALARGRR